MELLDLSTELLSAIAMLITDIKTCLEMMLTCKRILSLFSPDTLHGKKIFTRIRERSRWPDPNTVNMSDYTFLRAMYGRGCSMCEYHPQLRTPIWEFRGIRLCQVCFKRKTVRNYELNDVPQEHYSHLPNIRKSESISSFGTRSYRVYVKNDIPKEAPTATEIEHGRQHLLALRNFIIDVKRIVTLEKYEAKERNARLKNLRRKDVSSFLAKTVPELNPQLYTTLSTYESIVEKPTPFTARTGSMFLKKIKAEMAAKMTNLIISHVRLYTREMLTKYPMSIVSTLFDLVEYTDTETTFVQREMIPSKDKVESEMLLLVPIAEAIAKRKETQQIWLQRYGRIDVNKMLKHSSLYINAHSENEEEFAELAKTEIGKMDKGETLILYKVLLQ
jgi:hypothetical protein